MLVCRGRPDLHFKSLGELKFSAKQTCTTNGRQMTVASVVASGLAWSAGSLGIWRRIEQVHAAIVHLDSELQLVACCDIVFMVGTVKVLPRLQVGSARSCKLCLCCIIHDYIEALFGGRDMMATGPLEASRHLRIDCRAAAGQVPPRSGLL